MDTGGRAPPVRGGRAAKAAYDECIENGEDEEVCIERSAGVYEECVTSGCPYAAEAAYDECIENGGDEDGCIEHAADGFEECLE